MPHLTAEDFVLRTGARLLHVPYRGGAPMLQDLMSGQIDIAFMPFAGPILGMVTAGKLKVIGMANPTRLAARPSARYSMKIAVPKDFDYPVWSTFAASQAVKHEIANRLNKNLSEVMRVPEVLAWVKAAGIFASESRSLKGMADFYLTKIYKIRVLAKSVNFQTQ